MVGLDHRARIRWGSSRRSADSIRRGRGGKHDLQRKVDEVVERLAVGVVAHSRPAQLVGAEIDGIAVRRHAGRCAGASRSGAPGSGGRRRVPAAAGSQRRLGPSGVTLWRYGCSSCSAGAWVWHCVRGPVARPRRASVSAGEGPGQASVGGRWGPACRANGETAPQTFRSLSPYESRVSFSGTGSTSESGHWVCQTATDLIAAAASCWWS